MAYALTLGSLSVVTNAATHTNEDCECHEAREGCMPSFVFSIEGQVGFRTALHHLTECQKRDCQTLRSRVLDGMEQKLKWLLKEECLLGCVHIQPALYGGKRVILQRKDFPAIAHHLARCPKESCAQLRRAVLLNIRDGLRAA